jgi:hypothetical protein
MLASFFKRLQSRTWDNFRDDESGFDPTKRENADRGGDGKQHDCFQAEHGEACAD